MPDPKRLEFVTRHFKDLQTIRFAPIPAVMLLGSLAPEAAHMSRGAAWAFLLGLPTCIIGFYWWSTAAFKRRYGSVRASRAETQQMQGHPVLVALCLIVIAAFLWFKFVAPNRTYRSYLFDLFIILMILLPRLLDSTNPAVRRVVWAIGLVVLFGAGSFLIARGSDVDALAGAVWLSLSIFDFLLLRRTFAEISESPSGGATDVVARYG